MNPVNRALWFIETQFAGELTLETIADFAGVSRFHFSRVFALATGQTVMGYVRARRLAVAARLLAGGAPDILAIALDAGYSSHEAFTRAFREQLGVTPERVRMRAGVEGLPIQEPLKLDETLLTHLDPPRFEDGPTLLLAGLTRRYDNTSGNTITSAHIPAQWQSFVPHLGHIAGQVDNTTYGALYGGDGSGNWDYMSGVEISGSGTLPPELTKLEIPARRYAVFTHHGHISEIRRTWQSIFQNWMPSTGTKPASAPALERYAENFSSVEIWIPLSE